MDNIEKKAVRKQKRAYHRLLRDMNIKCCVTPTQNVLICNAGSSTGLQNETLERVVASVIPLYKIIMPLGRSYCFVKCSSEKDASDLYNYIHGRIQLSGQSARLYAMYTESIPDIDCCSWDFATPPGIRLIKDFISEEEEARLLKIVDWEKDDTSSPSLKHRRVKHFGYEFNYQTNNVNFDTPIALIPEECKYLQGLFEKHGCGQYEYDQLTINYYLPGQGIFSHIDTHSAFEDTILSLSLGSSCVMNFIQNDSKVSIMLPPRSLLVMANEARYAWSHGISPRHADVIKTANGIKTQIRGARTSFTFRKVRSEPCHCRFSQYCDSKDSSAASCIDETKGTQLEKHFVHEVYEEISSHFSETRSKQWPNVIKFLENLERGALLLDVGCGNGKYLQGDGNSFKVGCDRSFSLTKICRDRGFEVLVSDCLYLPYKNDSIDASLSIAVIHHLSTVERRKRAISEMTRVLRPNGICLISVWAKEQKRNFVKSSYLKYNSGKNSEENYSENVQSITDQDLMLPIHKNRTEFTHSDMLVPWKRKDGGNFLRYYHLFEEGELSKLCSEISSLFIKDVYYDQGNWCIILQKKI